MQRGVCLRLHSRFFIFRKFGHLFAENPSCNDRTACEQSEDDGKYDRAYERRARVEFVSADLTRSDATDDKENKIKNERNVRQHRSAVQRFSAERYRFGTVCLVERKCEKYNGEYNRENRKREQSINSAAVAGHFKRVALAEEIVKTSRAHGLA